MEATIETLAARVRAGETMGDLARELGMQQLALQGLFYRAGFTSAGEVRTTEPKPEWNWVVRTWQEPWMEDARCSWIGGDYWFPRQGLPGAATFAKQICLTECPVRDLCLEYAMRAETGASTWMRQGIFGGLTANERRKYEREWLAGREGAA